MYKIIGGKYKNITVLENIEEGTAKLLQDAINKINDSENQAKRIDGVIKSLEEYIAMVESFKNANLETTYMEEELKFKITNNLTHIKGFLDGTETYIKRKYKSGSEEEALWTKIKSKEYDNHFHYRFIDQFRNYVQHCSQYPFTEIRKYISEVNQEIVVEVIQSKTEFINDFKKIKSKFKDELISLNIEDINLTDMLIKEKESLIEINSQVLSKIGTRDLYNAALKVYEFKVKYPNYDALGMIKSEELKKVTSGKGEGLNIIPLKTNVAEYILINLVKSSRK